MVKCDYADCEADATVSFIFRAADGKAVSPRWRRCWGHATQPFPDDLGRLGGVMLEMNGPRDSEGDEFAPPG